MNYEEIKQQFSERIRENYDGFLKDWLAQEPEKLVSYAEEISATKMLYMALPTVASAEDMAHLLRYANPLEVVRDGWMSCNGGHISRELKDVLWFTEHNASLWAPYALSEEAINSILEKAPLTVREFLEHYPDVTFDMMTSSGYICLSPEQAQKLLAGESVMGNPGCSGNDMEIPAEELLDQTVANASFSDGAWHLFSVESPEQEPSAWEQEVTMC